MAQSRKNPTARPTKSKIVDRSKQIKRDDKASIYELGLYELDSTIKYYLDNVIIPTVKDHNDSLQRLPIVYGSQERWKSVQKTNFYRDAKGKIQLPIMMYKKIGIEKNRDLASKVDPNAPLVQNIKMRYSMKNKYDRFSLLYGRKPVEEYHRVVVPDFVNITYECILWTEFITQMNHIIEAINYAEGAYWGDPNKFSFKTKIDTFSPTSEVSAGKDRAVRCNFQIALSGFIIPQTLQKQINSQQTKTISAAKLTMGSERVVSDINEKPNDEPHNM